MRRKQILAAVLTACALFAASTAAQADRSNWPNSVTVGTASLGGTYFIYGGGWAQLITDVVGVPASVENTGGPADNAVLVSNGVHAFGMVTLGPAYDAWTGNSPLMPGQEFKNMRALFPMYATPFTVVTLANSGVDSVDELSGKRVGPGPASGTAGSFVPRFLKDVGVDATIQNGSWNDLSRNMQDGQVDAVFFGAGIPVSAASAIEAQQDINVFSFSDADQKMLLEKYPFLVPFTVPKGTYKAVTADMPTVAIWNFTIASKDMPEDFVYEVVKAVMENNERMMQTHKAARSTVPENVDKNGFLYFHPGAIKYFEEKGFDIPDNLYPPEYKKS
jgi:TRAP transporter TAXI family solute receptor